MPHVLIVEDDRDLREMLSFVLGYAGYSTETARHGAEALERAHQRRPCLVLLDLMMPVMSGWEFRDRQLRDPAIADVPVICVTAIPHDLALKGDLHLPVIPKPVDIDALLRIVAETCGGGTN